VQTSGSVCCLLACWRNFVRFTEIFFGPPLINLSTCTCSVLCGAFVQLH
jgi:hypothetical protein